MALQRGPGWRSRCCCASCRLIMNSALATAGCRRKPVMSPVPTASDSSRTVGCALQSPDHLPVALARRRNCSAAKGSAGRPPSFAAIRGSRIISGKPQTIVIVKAARNYKTGPNRWKGRRRQDFRRMPARGGPRRTCTPGFLRTFRNRPHVPRRSTVLTVEHLYDGA